MLFASISSDWPWVDHKLCFHEFLMINITIRWTDYNLFLQTQTNAQEILTTAVPMLTVIIPREDTTALVIGDITEMERTVNQVSQQTLYRLRRCLINYVIIHYTHLLSVFSLTGSLQLILDINATFRLSVADN